MAVRKPSCRLESLNADVQIAILSTCRSATDLHSLLRASPILYQTFLCHKSFILLRISFNLLGPAGIRDAVFLSHTYLCDKVPLPNESCRPTCFLHSDPVPCLDEVVGAYRGLLSIRTDDEGCPSTGELGWDTILSVSRLAKTAVYLSELYIRTRLRRFRTESYPYFNLGDSDHGEHDEISHGNTNDHVIAEHPWCDWEATTTENHQVRTALLRYEIAHQWDWRQHKALKDHEGLYKSLPLYQSWEWEQIRQIRVFVERLRNITLRMRGVFETQLHDKMPESGPLITCLNRLPWMVDGMTNNYIKQLGCRGFLGWLGIEVKGINRYTSPRMFELFVVHEFGR